MNFRFPYQFQKISVFFFIYLAFNPSITLALQCDNCIRISPDNNCRPFSTSYLETLVKDDVARSAFSSPSRHNLTEICHNSQMTVSFSDGGPWVQVEIRVGRIWDANGVKGNVGKCVDISVPQSASEIPVLKDILPNANIHSMNRVCSCNSRDFCNRVHGPDPSVGGGSNSLFTSTKDIRWPQFFLVLFLFLFGHGA